MAEFHTCPALNNGVLPCYLLGQTALAVLRGCCTSLLCVPTDSDNSGLSLCSSTSFGIGVSDRMVL